MTRKNLNLFPNPREVPLVQRLLPGLKEKVLPPREEEVEEVEEDALVLHHVHPYYPRWKMKPMNLLLVLLQQSLEEDVAKNRKYPLPKRSFMKRKKNLSYQFLRKNHHQKKVEKGEHLLQQSKISKIWMKVMMTNQRLPEAVKKVPVQEAGVKHQSPPNVQAPPPAEVEARRSRKNPCLFSHPKR